MEQLKRQAFLLFLFILTNAGMLFAQDFKKADDYYRAKSYADAIPLYEKGLAEKDNYSARSKLAFSYKMLNQMNKAAEQYAQIVNNERVRPDDYFYYGEALMSQAKYEEAKGWFLKFHELEPDEEKGLRMATACDQVPFLTPLFPDAKVMEFPYNTAYDDSSPVFYNNEMVFSSDRKAGIKFLKQKSGTTGRDFIRLYSSTLNENNEWSEPGSFSNKLNENNKNNANASFKSDGSEVYFTRNGNVSNRKDAFTLQLYSAKYEKDKWKDLEVVSVCKPAHNYMHPAISPDGNTLFFVSDKPGGAGGTDIYYAERKGEDWGRPINLDTIINTSAHEGFPFMNEDGKLYFCSKGHIGYGGFDIFVTEKLEDGTWTKPVNVGQPINSPLDDISIFINKENTRGAFTSSRNGNGDDIFLFSLDGTDPVAASQVVEPLNLVETNTDEGKGSLLEKDETEKVQDDTPEPAFGSTTPVIETTPIEEKIKEEVVKTDDVGLAEPENFNNKGTTVEKNQEGANSSKATSGEKSVISDQPAIQNTSLVNTPEMEVTPIDKEREPAENIVETVKKEVPEQKEVSESIEADNNIPASTEFVQKNTMDIESTTADHNAKLASDKKMATQKIMPEETLEVKEITSEALDPEIPIMNKDTEINPDVSQTAADDEVFQQDFSESEGVINEAMSPKAFQKAVQKNKYQVGMYYVLENMDYFPGEYLLVPKMTLQLDPIVKMLQEQPELKLEISVHTESIGYDENNLIISQKRAKAIKNYLLYKGIDTTRVSAIGLGESRLINHCANGVVCTEEEHLANQRVEVRVR